MKISTLDDFRDAIKQLIFDLGRLGFDSHGDRVNRMVFEAGAPLGGADLRDVAQLLREIRPDVESPLREVVSSLESFARKFRRPE